MAKGKFGKRKFGGKVYITQLGLSHKVEAQHRAKRLRTQGKRVRVCYAGKHKGKREYRLYAR